MASVVAADSRSLPFLLACRIDSTAVAVDLRTLLGFGRQIAKSIIVKAVAFQNLLLILRKHLV